MSATGNLESAPDDGGRTHPLHPAVTRLDDAECWELLRQVRFGRLVIAAVGDIDVFPINFAVDGQSIVFRTSEGTKLLESVISDLVAVEADERNVLAGEAWSVVAKGTPHRLERFDSIYAAQRLNIRPWIEDYPKEHFVRVQVRSISGRRFQAAPNPG
ncbi:MAG TPA: pyridoxamine 5'-phosphate oxidase family protein [Kineosporiaceae bacterium]|nr:pyridoxamine 5'-phosphate oxidase family protein [Kineosporiaceae bacterium]